jgi:hypothetical protein
MNFRSLVNSAFDLGRKIAPEAFPKCRIRLGPTTDVDPVADTDTTKWAVELRDIHPIQYDQKNQETAVDETTKIFAFPAVLFPPKASFSQRGEVDDGTSIWDAFLVQQDPTGSLILIHCRKQ